MHLRRRGPKDDAGSAVLSMVLSALVVTFFAAGVVRARGVRLAVVAVLLALALVLGLAGLVVHLTLLGMVTAGFSALQAWLLWHYTRTPWFAWQRTRPAGGPSLRPILAVAVLAGALGGLTVTQDPEPGLHVTVSSSHAPATDGNSCRRSDDSSATSAVAARHGALVESSP